MAYYRPDGIEAHGTPDGGFDLMVTRNGRVYHRRVEPEDFVTQIEAAVILRPKVSRVAVFKWVQSRKLKDEIVDGRSMIELAELRKFAARNGYTFAEPFRG